MTSRTPRRRGAALLIALSPCLPTLAQVAAPAAAASAPEATLPAVTVRGAAETDEPTQTTGAWTTRRSRSATGLAQSARETPQSMSTITRSQIDDFKLTSVNAVLDAATGVVAEKVETDRTYYTARGFDIVNFQIDGIGAPFAYGLVDGDLDTAVYDRIDVIRGATGLTSGTGNPSAAVNFVRKRPTRELQASAALTLGSWNDRRVDADVAGPLSADGRVRGRLVVAAQDKDSYLDRYHLKKGVFHGVVEADVTPDTTLSLGHTLQKNRPTGSMWGALPLLYSDGTPTDYDVSTSTAPSWTSWKSDTAITFAEARHQFANGWQAQAVLTHKQIRGDGKLFYVYGLPDPVDGSGLAIYPSIYTTTNRQDIADLRASGPFTLAGREHELVVGATTSRSRLHAQSTYGSNPDVGAPFPDLATWDGQYPESTFDVAGDGARFTDKQRNLYAATRLSASDALHLVLGANHTRIDSSGVSYSVSRARQETKTTPYVGAVWDVAPQWSLYGSWTSIFLPQFELGDDLQRLAPATGSNTELGVKAELLDKRLSASFAVFRARQANLASALRFDTATNQTLYEGVDTRSRGFEAEVVGALGSSVKLSAGYTQLAIHDDEGDDVRRFSPRRVLRAAGTWQALPPLKLGASVNWRSETSRSTGAGEIRQPSYALLNLMARWDFSPTVYATLNLDNVTDKKYLTSLYWDQGLYGEPRKASVSLGWSY